MGYLALSLTKIPFCFFDGRPEAQIHGAKDDEAPAEREGVKDSVSRSTRENRKTG